MADSTAAVDSDGNSYSSHMDYYVSRNEGLAKLRDAFMQQQQQQKQETETPQETNKSAKADKLQPPLTKYEEQGAIAPSTGAVIDNTHDVPYGAGASNTGDVVHIDKHVPRFDARVPGVDLHDAVSLHELTEKHLMDGGMSYEQAHIKATAAEKQLVEGMGGNWKEYSDVWDGHLAHIEHEDPKNPPPNLYLKPYAHKQQQILEKAGVHQPPEESGYTMSPNAEKYKPGMLQDRMNAAIRERAAKGEQFQREHPAISTAMDTISSAMNLLGPGRGGPTIMPRGFKMPMDLTGSWEGQQGNFYKMFDRVPGQIESKVANENIHPMSQELADKLGKDPVEVNRILDKYTKMRAEATTVQQMSDSVEGARKELRELPIKNKYAHEVNVQQRRSKFKVLNEAIMNPENPKLRQVPWNTKKNEPYPSEMIEKMSKKEYKKFIEDENRDDKY